MKRSELYLEHRHNGKFLRALRFESGSGPIFIGSAKQTDIRLMGHDVAGIHAVIENQGPDWRVSDLGSISGTYIANEKGEGNCVEHKLDTETEIKIGTHELKLYVREPRKSLFADDKSAQGTHQRIVLKFHDRVINTFVLSKNETFSSVVGGEKISLPPLTGGTPVIKEVGNVTVLQHLITPPAEEVKEAFRVTREMRLSAAAMAVIMLLLIPLMWWGKNKAEEERPVDNQFTKIIYDAKVLQQRRTRATAISNKSFGNMGMTQPKPESTPKDLGVSTKVISKIKASGLTQLIGKIAKRAGKSSTFAVNATANEKNPVTGQTFNTMGGTATGAGKQAANGFRIKGVGTDGVAGGGQYKEGSQLNGGTTGNAEVGVVEEETLVDGGLDREIIAAIIKEHLGEIRYCYERQLSASPDIYGKVQVKFVIGSAGGVTSQEIGTTTLKNAMVEGCILRRIARIKFPNPKGGTSVIVTYPFLFKSLN